MAGWNRIEIKNAEELPGHNWSYGFFHYPADYKRWDGKTWIRNFRELMTRDMTLFTLGDVKGKKILDIGCGEGVYLDIVARMGERLMARIFPLTVSITACGILKKKVLM